MSSEEPYLKPCPRCHHDKPYRGIIGGLYHVACDHCELRTSPYGTIECAISDWNRDYPPAPGAIIPLPWRPTTELPQEDDIIVCEHHTGAHSVTTVANETPYRLLFANSVKRWLLLRRPPSKPDPFEEAVRNFIPPYQDVTREKLRWFWNAAQAAAKENK